jgi:polyisoprenoid-binding protein YceI
MHRFVSIVILLTVALGCGKTGSSTLPAGTPAPSQSPGGVSGGRLSPEGANSPITFVGTKPDGKHDGGFTKVDVVIDMAPDLSSGRITADIDTESLWSDNPKLTNHLKTADFFEVNKYPKAMFVSTEIVPNKTGDATHTITGDLALHGVTKRISFPATITRKDGKVALNSKFTIQRADFGIVYQPERIHNDVAITVAVEVPSK